MMFDQGFARRVILGKGIVLILLGLLHEAAIVLLEHKRVQVLEPAHFRIEYLTYFAATGVFILLLGVIDILSYRGMRDGVPLAWQTALASSLSAAIAGAVGTAVYQLSPPTVLLLGGVCGTAALLFCGPARAASVIRDDPAQPSTPA